MSIDKKDDFKSPKMINPLEEETETVKGWVYKVEEHRLDNQSFWTAQIRIPKKIIDQRTNDKKTAWVNIYAFKPTLNNLPRNIEIKNKINENVQKVNEQIRNLKSDDFVAVKGKWHFRTDDLERRFYLSLSAVDVKVIFHKSNDQNDTTSVSTIENEENEKE